MRVTASALLVTIFCLSPLTLFAQRLEVTPAVVTMMEGESRDFTVVLSQEPTDEVTVTIAVRDGAAISLNRTELRFTPSNWNQTQTVRMMAQQDMDFVNNEGALILIASGGGYSGGGITVSPQKVIVYSLGETLQLEAAVHDQDGEPVTGINLEWLSADPSIAAVDSTGKVTAVDWGVTYITATFVTASGRATVSVNHPGESSDLEVLEMLFKATGGEEWTNQEGWLTDAPLNQWHGVQTDIEGYVTKLLLPNNNITGILPSFLGELHRLEGLELYGNRLSGPIPPELGNLIQLKTLDLTRNSLSGPIPSELGNLTQLKSLWLSENGFTGSIPSELGNLTQLEEVTLQNNGFTGSIPSELGNLTQLRQLLLHTNSLTGPIPPELGSLTQLQRLRLYNNSLTGQIPSELGNLTQLEELRLYDNSLTGSIPPEFGNLTQLVDLELNDNSLSGEIPAELGNLTKLHRLELQTNELTGLIPSELGRLGQLRVMDLKENSLSGLIPSELGSLSRLELLDLRDNSLAGVLPSELGNLTQLSELWLSYNNDLEGLLPRSLLGVNPRSLNITNTGICRQKDAVSLEWWDNIPRGGFDDCMPERVERLALIELYNKMGGTSWTNATGWAGGGPLGNWHGVSVENGRVTSLSLPNNSLEKSIPGEIGNFTELAVLNVADNSLTGTLPEEISYMSNLTELRVNGNAGLEGVLADDLPNLSKLEVLRFEGTSLCASPVPVFQEWYVGIGDANGTICNSPTEVQLGIPVAYLTQSVQTPEGSVRLVGGRDALLRVFVTGTPEPAFFQHNVVATVRGGGRTHRVEMTRDGNRIVATADESDLDNSFNAVIPGDLITPGATLVVEADPDGVVPRATDSQDRFPATGEEPLNVVFVPDMEITVVPVLEANQPDRSIFEWTNNIGDNSPEVGLLKYAFPFRGFQARSRESYVTSLDLTSNDGQWGLVLELEALRLLDKATGYYYGAAASVNGLVQGRARRGGWVSMGKAWDVELAHEVGHNLNLLNAPCGGVQRIDSDFPYVGGSVGAWGFDFRDSTLISPRYHRDIMSYCHEQGWLSDYHFEKVIDYREQVEGKDTGRPIARESDVLVLWGSVRGDELRIEPPFLVTASVQLPEANGPYRLEGLGQGAVLFTLSFMPREDEFGDKYFFFAVPIEQEWEESLDRIVLIGPEKSVGIDANDQRALTVFRDVRTGRVRGILRDWNGNLPAALLESANDLSIETIQGFVDSVHQQM